MIEPFLTKTKQVEAGVVRGGEALQRCSLKIENFKLK